MPRHLVNNTTRHLDRYTTLIQHYPPSNKKLHALSPHSRDLHTSRFLLIPEISPQRVPVRVPGIVCYADRIVCAPLLKVRFDFT